MTLAAAAAGVVVGAVFGFTLRWFLEDASHVESVGDYWLGFADGQIAERQLVAQEFANLAAAVRRQRSRRAHPTGKRWADFPLAIVTDRDLN
jgi:hypothetical protein